MQRKAIASNLLDNMQDNLNIPAIDILDYIRTRNLYDEMIKNFFHISMKQAQTIRQLIKEELEQKGQG